MEVEFFETTKKLHAWFKKHGQTRTEVWIGFYRKGSSQSAVTYVEALDEALCWGWIDGIRKKLDDESYTNRFTPRKPKSIWSNVNVAHVERLTAAGRMMPAGLAAFAQRDESRTGIYSFEKDPVELSGDLLAAFQKQRKAWEFFIAQPPGYRRQMTHWVVSAKREETQLRRLEELIRVSKLGQRR